jgi:NAD(P)-dependent dehydrogenase (short-subunit alcohol dehydrogenase family)
MQDNTRLTGKVAIVTGAGSRNPGAGGTTIGNGRAIAVLMAARGAKVLLLDVDRAALEETARLIAEEGGVCALAEADVSKADDCAAAVAEAVRLWGRVDILVNNVGISGPAGNAEGVDPEAWDYAMQVNVKSVMLMAKYAVPEMRKSGGGAIVNLSSVAGLRAGHPGLLYATTKGAIVQMTRAMAGHHGADNIRVNAVAPGYVYTPMVASRGMTEELRQQRAQSGMLKIEGSAWDVAEAACFLASPAARWITGQTLPVDAGRSAGNAAGASPKPAGALR